ncbi:hypothetical protein TNCT_253081, partial [Trichonephila clavata]
MRSEEGGVLFRSRVKRFAVHPAAAFGKHLPLKVTPPRCRRFSAWGFGRRRLFFFYVGEGVKMMERVRE